MAAKVERKKRKPHPLKKKYLTLLTELLTVNALRRKNIMIGLDNARLGLKDMIRSVHLARMFLKSRPIKETEAYCFTLPDFETIEYLALQHAKNRPDFDIRNFRQEFAAWRDGAELRDRPPATKLSGPGPLTEAVRAVRTVYGQIEGRLGELYSREDARLWWRNAFTAAVKPEWAGRTPQQLFAAGRGSDLVMYLHSIDKEAEAF